MKNVRIYGKDLRTQISIGITVDSDKLSSFAIAVKFVEKEKEKKGKLILKTKNTLPQEDKNKEILCFTGTIITDKTYRPCMGYCYRDEDIEEVWMTIIEPETEVLKVNTSKTEFIEKAKEYYRSQNLKFTEDGNLVEAPSLFRIPGRPWGMLIEGKVLEIATEMQKNLFPIVRKKEGKEEVFFGEYTKEYHIRTCSVREALLRGVKIC